MAWDGNSISIKPRSCSLELKRLVILIQDWNLTVPSLIRAEHQRHQYNEDCRRAFEGTQPEWSDETKGRVRARARVRFIPQGQPMLPGFVVEGVIKRQVGRGYDIRDVRGKPYYAHPQNIVGYYDDNAYISLRSFEERERVVIDIEF